MKIHQVMSKLKAAKRKLKKQADVISRLKSQLEQAKVNSARVDKYNIVVLERKVIVAPAITHDTSAS